MKPYLLFLSLFFLLVSCTPSTPLPTETPIPTATATLTPVPIITPTATPEPWVSIVDEYGLPEDMAKELGVKEVTVEETVYGMALKDDAGNVLFEQIRGEWKVAKNYEWVTSFENFQNSFIPPDEILNGNLYAWVMREVIPNVEYEDNRTDKTRIWSDSNSKYLLGYPGRSIKGVAYLNTRVDGRDYRVIVNVYEDTEGEKWPVILVYEYSGDYFENINEFWEGMRLIPIIMSSTNAWGKEDPFVEESQKLLGENVIMNDLKELVPEELDGLPDNASFKLFYAALDLLTPDQLAEYNRGEGGIVFASYMFQNGDPSFMSQPGVIFHTFAAIGEIYE